MANIYVHNGDNDDLHARAEEIAYFQSGDVREMQNALSDWNARWYPRHRDGMDGNAGSAGRAAGHGDAATARRPAGRERTRARRPVHAADDRAPRRRHPHGASTPRSITRLGDVRDLARAMAANQEMEIGELNHVRQDLGLPLYRARTGS